MSQTDAPLLKTALHAEHLRLGARIVPFAGYEIDPIATKTIAGARLWFLGYSYATLLTRLTG